jgi:hypothetical protein
MAMHSTVCTVHAIYDTVHRALIKTYTHTLTEHVMLYYRMKCDKIISTASARARRER